MLVTLPDNFEMMSFSELERFFYSNGDTWLANMLSTVYDEGKNDGESYEQGYDAGIEAARAALDNL